MALLHSIVVVIVVIIHTTNVNGCAIEKQAIVLIAVESIFMH